MKTSHTAWPRKTDCSSSGSFSGHINDKKVGISSKLVEDSHTVENADAYKCLPGVVEINDRKGTWQVQTTLIGCFHRARSHDIVWVAECSNRLLIVGNDLRAQHPDLKRCSGRCEKPESQPDALVPTQILLFPEGNIANYAVLRKPVMMIVRFDSFLLSYHPWRYFANVYMTLPNGYHMICLLVKWFALFLFSSARIIKNKRKILHEWSI